MIMLAAAVLLSMAGQPAKAAPSAVWIDELDLTAVEQDWGQAHARKSVDGHPLSIGGTKFDRGVGTHAASEVTVELGGGAQRFEAMVGVDDEPCSGAGSVVFIVLGDGKELARTPVMRLHDAPRAISADLKGISRLTLLVEDGGDGINYDHADWGDARIVINSGSTAKATTRKASQTQMPIAPASKGGAARLNFPRVTGVSPGKPLLFRIPASGDGPITFSASGLPEGVELDTSTGIIRGTIKSEGRWTVQVTGANASGRQSAAFTIVCAPNAVALTPPMGWNSWNCWALAVDDAKVRAAAEAIATSGLAAHGYQYVNIDDAWEGSRDAAGIIRCNEKFPDMAGLATFVHDHGLKLGIYSSPGPKTCAGYEGSYQHELADAKQYAAWGIDYLKYDWCSYGEIQPHPDLSALMKPYEIMRDALRAQDRDILFSLCQYGMGDVWKWGAKVDGNCWRTTGDITDTWSSMAGIGFSQTVQAPFAGPGRWNDPDMLVVGKVGWGPSLHPSRLTHNEQITHLTLWSMLAAPLLIGCDLSQMDEFTMAVLTNDEVIAVDQDPLGKQASRVVQNGQTEIWTRPLQGGSTAVAFFNRSRGDVEMSATLEQLKITDAVKVRDAWMHRDLDVKGDLHAKVPSHAACLYIVTPAGG